MKHLGYDYVQQGCAGLVGVTRDRESLMRSRAIPRDRSAREISRRYYIENVYIDCNLYYNT